MLAMVTPTTASPILPSHRHWHRHGHPLTLIKTSGSASYTVRDQTRFLTMTTTIAAPIAVASATRVRSDGVRRKIRDSAITATAA